MVRRSLICVALSLSAGAAGGLSSQPAAAQAESPSKASCAQAYESAQESRASGQLQETRQRLSFCARAECPNFVQKDCARWLEEVDRELPSIVIYALGLDADATAQASVKVDGQLISNALTGAPIVLDPGRHELIIERPGALPVTRTIVAQQGVQNRSIKIELGSVTDGSAASAGGQSPTDTGASMSMLRPYAYAAWAVGAVGLGTFAVLGTLGRADQQSYKDECPEKTPILEDEAPGICFEGTLDQRQSTYKREFLFADIGLVTGIAGAAAGTVLFILSETGSSSSDGIDASLEAATGLHLDVSPTPGGVFATVQSEF